MRLKALHHFQFAFSGLPFDSRCEFSAPCSCQDARGLLPCSPLLGTDHLGSEGKAESSASCLGRGGSLKQQKSNEYRPCHFENLCPVQLPLQLPSRTCLFLTLSSTSRRCPLLISSICLLDMLIHQFLIVCFFSEFSHLHLKTQSDGGKEFTLVLSRVFHICMSATSNELLRVLCLNEV